MLKLLKKIRDSVLGAYSPNPYRRKEVVHFLSQRPPLTHDEWHRQFAAAQGIPLSFVAWYRDTCSKYFEYDLSGALPDDKLVDDLGFTKATWSDADWDIFEDFEFKYGCELPSLENIETFGQLMESLWLQARMVKAR